MSHYLPPIENRGYNWSCLCDEASVKIPRVGVQRASRSQTHSCWKGDAPQLHGDNFLCWDPSKALPSYLFIWLVICSLYRIL